MKKPPSKKKSTPVTVENTVNVKFKEDDIKYREAICIKESDFPVIKNWKVGGKYKLIVDVELTGMSKGEGVNKEMRGEFRINKVKEG